MSERLNSNELDGGKYVVLHEFVKAAKQKLNANIWDYLIGGTETETTLARNRMAIDTVALRPRVLNDVSTVDTGVDFFGHRIRLPVFLAPVGSLESFEAGGGASEIGAWITERQANAFDAVFVAAGEPLVVHLDVTLPIDHDPAARRLDHHARLAGPGDAHGFLD
jgi:hypothetical protein